MKPFWQSKTLWINLAMAAAAFFPAAQRHLDMESMGVIFTGVNAVLRLVTKDKITLK